MVHDNGSRVIAPGRIETVAELPYQLHADHPKPIELWPEARPASLLVIYDVPSPERTDPEAFTVRAALMDRRRRLLHTPRG